ncbi:pseudouridine synthase [Luminiphilus syltensis]|nr:16S rRNA pseudouridine(516) synthase [Luminiphilus syltensis]
MLAQARVTIDGVLARDAAEVINPFSRIAVDGVGLPTNTPHYIMLNKPSGVVCATRDARHRTVIDILDLPFQHTLHIVGRLDIQSTGLVLLTNDGQWSRRLSLPQSKFAKHYRVTTEQAITSEQIAGFEAGIFFAYEGLTTRPARLHLINSHEANVTLTEGRYHQIRRMFGRYGNRVLSIHRYATGPYVLSNLRPGQYREISP